MKKIIMLVALLGMIPSLNSYAYDCNTNCHDAAKYVVNTPFGHVTNYNPLLEASCNGDKEISCELWNQAFHVSLGEFKSRLRDKFNAHISQNLDPDFYMALCLWKAKQIGVAVGAALGEPWDALINGPAGDLVLGLVCEASRNW